MKNRVFIIVLCSIFVLGITGCASAKELENAYNKIEILEDELKELEEENEELEEQNEELEEELNALKEKTGLNMKEFAADDGSCTIRLNKEWVVEDTGMENWIAAFNEIGTEGAMVMQFTKGVMDANVSNISDIKVIVEESYVISDIEIIEVESSVLKNLEAYTCNMDVDGIDGEGCVAYGETNYAYYVILSLESGSRSDKAVEAFRMSVASLTESAQ